eukprot:6688724-Alexandrium_andersonii.AAC.1
MAHRLRLVGDCADVPVQRRGRAVRNREELALLGADLARERVLAVLAAAFDSAPTTAAMAPIASLAQSVPAQTLA